MAVNGIYSGVSNVYESIFGSSSDSGSGMFSLGDYNMIQNGTYKKLMKAYYASMDDNKKSGRVSEDEDDETTSSSSKTSSKKSESKALVNIQSSAAALNNSLEDLKKASLYEPVKDKDGKVKKDEDGNDVYDRDAINKSVKKFVESYNAYLKASDDVDTVSVLRKSLNITKETSSHSKLLSEIGITIGEDNKLVLDEEKLGKAKMSTLSSMFSSTGSYGDQVKYNARQSYQAAGTQIYRDNTKGSSYTYQGGYSIMGNSGILDKYL